MPDFHGSNLRHKNRMSRVVCMGFAKWPSGDSVPALQHSHFASFVLCTAVAWKRAHIYKVPVCLCIRAVGVPLLYENMRTMHRKQFTQRARGIFQPLCIQI